MQSIWDSIWNAGKEILITGVAGIIVTSVLGIIVGWLKKGKMEAMGNLCGRYVSKFARQKIGKKFWERIEDIFTLSILSFVKGFKLGSDMDDSLDDDVHIDAGKVIKIEGKNESTIGMDGAITGSTPDGEVTREEKVVGQ